jgi:hypothetical protein
MLYITEHNYPLPQRVQEWRAGDPVPKINTRVVTIQADGDELWLILEAMRESVEK